MTIFSSYDRLEKSLLKSGTSATATVLEAQQAPTFWESGGLGGQDNPSHIPWAVALRVAPDGGGSEFEVRQKLRVPYYMDLAPSQTLQVLYDPGDPTRMVLDPRTVPQTADEASAAYARAMLGSMGADTSGLENAPNAETVAEIVGTRHRDAANETIQRVEQARAAGAPIPPTLTAAQVQLTLQHMDNLRAAGLIDDARYETAKAQLMAASGATAPSAAAPSAAPPADHSAELAQLDALHARGALTDDEYQAARTKLL